MDVTKKINPIKEVLVKKKRTYKWLAEQLRKGLAAMPQWCTNTLLQGLAALLPIANMLKVGVKKLLNSTLAGEVQMAKVIK